MQQYQLLLQEIKVNGESITLNENESACTSGLPNTSNIAVIENSFNLNCATDTTVQPYKIYFVA